MSASALLHWYGRLSSRLLMTTALWVTFMVAAIGYSMALSWEIESSARTQSLVASLNGKVYRSNLMVDRHFSQAQFEAQIAAVDTTLAAIRAPTLWDYVLIKRIDVDISSYDREWHYVLVPLMSQARSLGRPVQNERVEEFIQRLDQLQEAIIAKRGEFLQIQSRLQALLMTLAVVSLFVIMFFLVRWVIRPTDQLAAGINRVIDGHLETRISLEGSKEFEDIGQGFNRMTARLQDLVENLEAKVKEKTETVEEKNRNLTQLYEVSHFFGQQHSVDELCEGFTTLLMQSANAASCAVFLLDAKKSRVELTASADLPESSFARLSRTPVSYGDVADIFAAEQPLRLSSGHRDRRIPALALEDEGAEQISYVFHIRNSGKDFGFFVMYYPTKTTLAAQTCRLYETFGANLATALENIRLIERDQQFAVIQERTLMAQGLHDSIAQTLSFLNLQVQLLESALKSGDSSLVGETVAQIKAGVQESYEDVRELLLNFRERLHKESFAEGIATVIDRFEAQTGLKVQLTNIAKGAQLTDKQKLQVIFIMQEALANVRKHSQASEVSVRVRNEDDFEMVITDNGIGIDEAILLERSKRHVGLNIMKERASRIGAQVTVANVDPSVAPSGTVVRLVIGEKARREVQ